eukprot:gnl/Dysnectes_brevis/2773_a3377_1165.p1 GENE.gnl/Dysnectes_brevis/2773_a3377_1165~~gnl/Dysnectes_brevis/2773_a3377_1165.p1  ORF type:complete len:1036 (-),score=374.84 gnl/Dysnectes_brevis/2773_a3377_1165:85-3192(-)
MDGMNIHDPSELPSLFEQTVNPSSPDSLKSATQILTEMKEKIPFLQQSFAILSDRTFPFHVRLSASIQFKQCVTTLILDVQAEQREAMALSIVDHAPNTEVPIQKQLIEAYGYIMSFYVFQQGLPERLERMIAKIRQLMDTMDWNKITLALEFFELMVSRLYTDFRSGIKNQVCIDFYSGYLDSLLRHVHDTQVTERLLLATLKAVRCYVIPSMVPCTKTAPLQNMPRIVAALVVKMGGSRGETKALGACIMSRYALLARNLLRRGASPCFYTEDWKTNLAPLFANVVLADVHNLGGGDVLAPNTAQEHMLTVANIVTTRISHNGKFLAPLGAEIIMRSIKDTMVPSLFQLIEVAGTAKHEAFKDSGLVRVPLMKPTLSLLFHICCDLEDMMPDIISVVQSQVQTRIQPFFDYAEAFDRGDIASMPSPSPEVLSRIFSGMVVLRRILSDGAPRELVRQVVRSTLKLRDRFSPIIFEEGCKMLVSVNDDREFTDQVLQTIFGLLSAQSVTIFEARMLCGVMARFVRNGHIRDPVIISQLVSFALQMITTTPENTFVGGLFTLVKSAVPYLDETALGSAIQQFFCSEVMSKLSTQWGAVTSSEGGAATLSVAAQSSVGFQQLLINTENLLSCLTTMIRSSSSPLPPAAENAVYLLSATVMVSDTMAKPALLLLKEAGISGSSTSTVDITPLLTAVGNAAVRRGADLLPDALPFIFFAAGRTGRIVAEELCGGRFAVSRYPLVSLIRLLVTGGNGHLLVAGFSLLTRVIEQTRVLEIPKNQLGDTLSQLLRTLIGAGAETIRTIVFTSPEEKRLCLVCLGLLVSVILASAGELPGLQATATHLFSQPGTSAFVLVLLRVLGLALQDSAGTGFRTYRKYAAAIAAQALPSLTALYRGHVAAAPVLTDLLLWSSTRLHVFGNMRLEPVEVPPPHQLTELGDQVLTAQAEVVSEHFYSDYNRASAAYHRSAPSLWEGVASSPYGSFFELPYGVKSLVWEAKGYEEFKMMAKRCASQLALAPSLDDTERAGCEKINQFDMGM